MVIKASAGAQIRQLVAALTGPDGLRREAAAARLTVIGGRAVAQLQAAFPKSPDPAARVAILRVLDRLADPRTLPLARDALRGHPDVALAATCALRPLLDSRMPGVAAAALDALVTVALDQAVPRPVRVAAFEALGEMSADVRAHVAAALGLAPGSERPESSARPSGAASASGVSAWEAALLGGLPDRPAVIAGVIAAGAAVAPLTSLQKLVDALREREHADGPAAAEWSALRGAVHHALSLRGSRVALYDLRESLSAASAPLPVSFLAAVHEVGDRSCLEPLALAYVNAGPEHEWWRQQLAAALRALLTREKLTARSAVVKRLASRWPAAIAGTNRPSRTTPPR